MVVLVVLASETTSIVLVMRTSLVIAAASTPSSVLVTGSLSRNLKVHIVISVALSLIILSSGGHFLSRVGARLVAQAVFFHRLKHLLTCVMLRLLLLASKRVILGLFILEIMTLHIILASKTLISTLFIVIICLVAATTVLWIESLLTIIRVADVVLLGIMAEIILV